MAGKFHACPIPRTMGLSFEKTSSAAASPFKLFIHQVQTKLANTPPSSVHRVLVPSLLSPTLYAGSSCDPAEVLQFLHALRALLRLYPKRLTALISLPISLHPRRAGLTRWMELLSDGVIEFVPLPSSIGPAGPPPGGNSSGKTSKDKEAEKMQGMVKVHAVPVYHEKGGGGAEGNYFRDNLSFSLSISKGLVIQPYSLPPLVDDEEHKEKSPATTIKDGIDF